MAQNSRGSRKGDRKSKSLGLWALLSQRPANSRTWARGFFELGKCHLVHHSV